MLYCNEIVKHILKRRLLNLKQQGARALYTFKWTLLSATCLDYWNTVCNRSFLKHAALIIYISSLVDHACIKLQVNNFLLAKVRVLHYFKKLAILNKKHIFEIICYALFLYMSPGFESETSSSRGAQCNTIQPFVCLLRFSLIWLMLINLKIEKTMVYLVPIIELWTYTTL